MLNIGILGACFVTNENPMKEMAKSILDEKVNKK